MDALVVLTAIVIVPLVEAPVTVPLVEVALSVFLFSSYYVQARQFCKRLVNCEGKAWV